MPGLDSNTKFLSHFNGSNGSTTFYDSLSHTVTSVNGAALDTSTKKLGSASLKCTYQAPDSNTQLMLNMDGDDNGTTFTDLSQNGLTIYRGGNVKTEIDQLKFGFTSAYFDGTNDYLLVDNSDGELDFGTGDFTIELWINNTSQATSGNYRLIDFRQSNATEIQPALSMKLSNLSMGVGVYVVNGTEVITGTTDIIDGTWHHIALVRKSGTTKLYVDGTQEGSDYSDSNNYTGATNVYIANRYDSSGDYKGYIDDLRMSNNARYTADFTAPTSSLVKYGYATVSSSSDWDFGTGDYTIDFWMNYMSSQPKTASGSLIFDFRQSASSETKLALALDDAANLFLFYNSSIVLQGDAVLSADTWYHIAIVRNSGTTKLYINGTAETNTWSDSNDYNNTANGWKIGSRYDDFRYYLGYIDEFRISNNARWTTDFTPSTSEYSQDKTVTGNISVLASIPSKTTSSGGGSDTPKEVISYIDILGLIPRLINKRLSTDIDITGTIPRDSTKAVSHNIEVSSIIPRNISKLASGNINISTEVVRLLGYNKSLISSVDVSASLLRLLGYNKELTGNVEVSAEVLRLLAYNKALSGNIDIVGTVDRLLMLSKVLSTDVDVSGNIPRMIDRYVTGNIEVSANMLRQLVISKDITGYIDISGSISRDIIRDTISNILVTGYSTGAGTKNKILTANIEITGIILRNLGLNKILSSDIVVDGYSQRGVTKNINGYVDIDSNISRLLVISKLLTGNVDVSGLISRDMAKYINADISITGYIDRFKTTPKILISNVDISGAITRSISKILIPQIRISPVVVRELMKFMSGSVNVTGYKSKDIGQILTALVSMYGYVGGAEADPNRIIGINISIIDKDLGITLIDKTTGMTITDKDMIFTLTDKLNGLTITDKALNITIK